MVEAATTSSDAARAKAGSQVRSGARTGSGCGSVSGCGGCGGVDDGAAVGAGGEVREDAGALVVEERVFGEGGEEIGVGVRSVGVRTRGLALGQVGAQSAGR